MHSTRIPKLARVAGMFLLNLLQAILGTTILELPLYGLFRWKTPEAFFLREYVLSAAVSFAIGYLVYHHWQSASSKWLWLAGLAWLGLGAFLIMTSASVLDGAGRTIYEDMSGISCVSDPRSTRCANYFNYTVPSLRVVWFSLGALCCARIKRFREAR